MESSHFLLFNVSEKGHMHPTLAVVNELTTRGAKVTYVVFPWTPDTVEYSTVEANGATYVNFYDLTEWRWEGGPGPFSNIPLVHNTHQDILKWTTTLSPAPTAVMHDPFACIGPFVAHKLNLPLITSISNTPFTGPTIGRFCPVEEIERLHEEHGVDLGHNSWLHLTLPHTHQSAFSIMYTLPQFVPQLPAEVTEKIFFAGSLLSKRSAEEGAEPLVAEITQHKNNGKKILLISLGTVVTNKFTDEKPEYKQFLSSLLDATTEVAKQRSNVEVYCVLIGAIRNWLTDRVDELPSNYHTCSYISQLQVLPHVDAFLTHGGANSFNEALYFGTPLLVVPFHGDQIGNAETAQSLGVGYAFHHDESVELNANTNPNRKSVSVEGLNDALDFVFSDSVQDKAREYSTMFQERTPQNLVDNLISWLERK